MSDIGLEVIQTKLVPPLRDTSLVVRNRLLAKINDSAQSTVILIKAPAGYGKTTLIGQWFASLDERTCIKNWYSIDSKDNDLSRFFTYLVSAIRVTISGFGKSVVGQLSSGVRINVGSLSGAFINEISALDKELFFVFDDIHLITNKEVIEALGDILGNAPLNLHFVVSSRETPSFHLGRLRALGRLTEITSDELRFRIKETSSFMSLAGYSQLTPDQIYSLEKHTEGWATGLQLASIALSGRQDITSVISNFTGKLKDLSDFLTEDVLLRQDEKIQEFLIKTSILERLCPELCDYVTDTKNSRKMLDALESKSLFLFSLDDEREWYRYHHLFSEFLNKYLEINLPEQSCNLHIRASQWFSDNDYIEEAFQHALAGGDMERAAMLLNQSCDDLFYSGRLSTLAEWYRQIPKENLRNHPRILLDQAWSVILEWNFTIARKMLDEISSILQEIEVENESEEEIIFLGSMLKHREMMYALFKDDMVIVERLCKEMLENFPPKDPYLRGNLYTCRIYAQREMFLYDNVNEYNAKSLQLYEEANSRFVIIWHNSILGPTELSRGNFDKAEDSLRLAKSIASEISGELSPLAAMPGILLAEVLYERNQIDETKRLLDQYLPLADKIGFVDQLIAGYVCLSRLAMIEGDITNSKRILRKAEEISLKKEFNRLRISIEAEECRQLLLAGDIKSAKDKYHSIFSRINLEELIPKTPVINHDAIKALLWCRLIRFQNISDEVLATCKKWISFTKKRNALRLYIQFNIQLSFILIELGETRKAMRTFRNALDVALQKGIKRTVIDEMDCNLTLLTNFVNSQYVNSEPVVEFAKSLLEIAGNELGINRSSVNTEEPAVIDESAESLTDRERQILEMVSNGLLNREIADSLSLTEGSVKWHLQQVYNKIGVRRRSQAVQRAKELGYIS